MASTLTVDNIEGATSSSAVHIPNHVIQIVQSRNTDLFTHNAAAGTYSSNITGLEVTITPKLTNSKILIICDVFASTAHNSYPALWNSRLMRGTTVIAALFQRGEQASATTDNASGGCSVSTTFLDSPSTTSAITYGVQITQSITGGNLNTYVNGKQSGAEAGQSSILAMEIAQ